LVPDNLFTHTKRLTLQEKRYVATPRPLGMHNSNENPDSLNLEVKPTWFE